MTGHDRGRSRHRHHHHHQHHQSHHRNQSRSGNLMSQFGLGGSSRGAKIGAALLAVSAVLIARKRRKKREAAAASTSRPPSLSRFSTRSFSIARRRSPSRSRHRQGQVDLRRKNSVSSLWHHLRGNRKTPSSSHYGTDDDIDDDDDDYDDEDGNDQIHSRSTSRSRSRNSGKRALSRRNEWLLSNVSSSRVSSRHAADRYSRFRGHSGRRARDGADDGASAWEADTDDGVDDYDNDDPPQTSRKRHYRPRREHQRDRLQGRSSSDGDYGRGQSPNQKTRSPDGIPGREARPYRRMGSKGRQP